MGVTSVEEERGLGEEGEEDEDSYRTSQVPTSLFDVETMVGKGPESLREIRKQLEVSAATTEGMMSSLGEFDSKLTNLEHLMKPIEDQTSLLKNAHSNIARCAEAMESILKHFRTAAEAAPVLRGGGGRGVAGGSGGGVTGGMGLAGGGGGASVADVNAFLQQLDAVKASLDFFRVGAAASFVSTPEAVRELSSLHESGLRQCQEAFVRILAEEGARRLDLRESTLAAEAVAAAAGDESGTAGPTDGRTPRRRGWAAQHRAAPHCTDCHRHRHRLHAVQCCAAPSCFRLASFHRCGSTPALPLHAGWVARRSGQRWRVG
jgi:hypothetical protein